MFNLAGLNVGKKCRRNNVVPKFHWLLDQRQASRNGVTGKYRQLLELPESIQTIKVKLYTSFKGLTYIWKSTVNILVCLKHPEIDI